MNEEPKGIWINPADTEDVLVRLDQFELQLIVMALDWAVEKSEAKAGAQTKPLRRLEQRIRALHHQRVRLVNLINEVIELRTRLEDLENELL